MPLKLATRIQVGSPVHIFAMYAKLAGEFEFETKAGSSTILREPVGVVAAITPWNYPLHQIAAKVAPALAAGCTLVLKPSEVAPLNAFVLADVDQPGGFARGRVQSRERLRSDGGRGAGATSRRGHGVVHRLDARREDASSSWRLRRSSASRWSSAANRRRSSSMTPDLANAVKGTRQCVLSQFRADLQRPYADAGVRRASTTRRRKSPSKWRARSRSAIRSATRPSSAR